MNKLDKIENIKLNLCNSYSVYEYDGLSLQEIICQFYTELMQVVDSQNELIEVVNSLTDEGLKNVVLEQLNIWLEDGTLSHIINGKIYEDLITYEPINIIYVSSAGNDSNKGSLDEPVLTIEKAFEILRLQGSKNLFEQWKIKIGQGVFKGCKIDSLPLFTKPLIIEGTVNATTNSVSTIISKQGNENIGLWIEPAKGVSIEITNIEFRDFKVDFNGYGLLMKNQGYIWIKNCVATNCDCGFAGINNVTITAWDCVANNCDYGYRIQYCSSGTIGALNHSSYANNCKHGVFVSRNAVAHSDYVIYTRCEQGLHVDMNSRVANISNLYDNCGIGIKIEGGAEVNLGTGYDIDRWINMEKYQYVISGNGRLTRTQSLYTKNESLFFEAYGDDINNVGTGSVEQIELFRSSPSNVGTLPNYYLNQDNVKIRVLVYGLVESAEEGTKSLTLKMIGLNEDNTSNGQNIDFTTVNFQKTYSPNTSFTCEFIYSIRNKKGIRTYNYSINANSLSPGENKTNSFYSDAELKTEGKKQFRLYCKNNNANDIIKIQKIECYITN